MRQSPRVLRIVIEQAWKQLCVSSFPWSRARRQRNEHFTNSKTLLAGKTQLWQVYSVVVKSILVVSRTSNSDSSGKTNTKSVLVTKDVWPTFESSFGSAEGISRAEVVFFLLLWRRKKWLLTHALKKLEFTCILSSPAGRNFRGEHALAHVDNRKCAERYYRSSSAVCAQQVHTHVL